jgi:hypothetical protein
MGQMYFAPGFVTAGGGVGGESVTTGRAACIPGDGDPPARNLRRQCSLQKWNVVPARNALRPVLSSTLIPQIGSIAMLFQP